MTTRIELGWAHEPDDYDDAHIDELTCAGDGCTNPVGLWADVDDDTGSRIGGFVEYGFTRIIHDDGSVDIADERYCEDCTDMVVRQCVRPEPGFSCRRGALVDDTGKRIERCDCCGGHGVHVVVDGFAERTCPECDGMCINDDGVSCPTCDGRGFVYDVVT